MRGPDRPKLFRVAAPVSAEEVTLARLHAAPWAPDALAAFVDVELPSVERARADLLSHTGGAG